MWFGLVISLVFGFCVGVNSQQIKGNDLNVTVIEHGSQMELYLNWTQRKCYGSFATNPVYRLEFCDSNKYCDMFGPILEWNFRIKESKVSMIFWKKYTIKIEAGCNGYYTTQAYADIPQLPGGLLPPTNVQVKAILGGANITWSLPDETIQNVATNVSIIVCNKETDICQSEAWIEAQQSEYIAKDLLPGEDYYAQVRLVKMLDGKTYTSEFKSRQFESFPPDKSKYPPVKSIDYTIIGNNSELVNVLINCTRPDLPNGRQWWGISVTITNKIDHVLESVLHEGDSVLVRELPILSHLVARVSPMYIEKSTLVRAAYVEIIVNTGVGDFPKPVITNLMAIDENTATLEWSHVLSASMEIEYEITWSSSNRKLINNTKLNYMLIDRLEPSQTYVVSITASVVYGGDTFKKVSDTQNVTALPRNALTPRVGYSKIQSEGIYLTWSVDLPEDPAHCTFQIEICGADSSCIRYNQIEPTERSKLVDFFRYNQQKIRIQTICTYKEAPHISRVSNTLSVYGKYNPAPPINVTAKAESEENIRVTFSIQENERAHVYIVTVTWRLFGKSSGSKEDVRVDKNKEFNTYLIPYLQKDSAYNISLVAAVYDGGYLYSEPLFVNATTFLPTPKPATNVTVFQYPLSNKIRVNWQGPSYPFSELKFKIDVVCKDRHAIVTVSDLSTDILANAKADEVCDVQVFAVTDKAGAVDRPSSPASAKIEFEAIGEPRNVVAVFIRDFEYEIRLIPPYNAAVMNATYQITREGTPYSDIKHSVENIKYTGERPYVRNYILTRCCVDGLCSKDASFHFLSNVGVPGPVENLKTELSDDTNIRVQWQIPIEKQGPIDGYILELRDPHSMDDIITIKQKASQTEYTFTGLKEFVEYEVHVRAFNKDLFKKKNIRMGNFVSMNQKTSGKAAPPPVNLQVITSPSGKGLSWDAPAASRFLVTHYHVVATPESENNTVPISIFTNQQILPFEKLDSYTWYEIVVSSCIEASGECGVGATKRLQTEPGYPSEPLAIVVNLGTTSVDIKWLKPKIPAGPIDGYSYSIVEKALKESSGNWTVLLPDRLFAIITDLQQSTQYIIRVRAFNIDSDESLLYSPMYEMEITTLGLSGGSVPWPAMIGAVIGALLLGSIAFVAYRKYYVPKFDKFQRIQND